MRPHPDLGEVLMNYSNGEKINLTITPPQLNDRYSDKQ